jgi:hypothetical protein
MSITFRRGVDFVSYLESQVAVCDVFLAVIGPNWLDAKDENGNRRIENPEDFVSVEIAAALGRDIRVIPVLVDGARMPKAADLPDSLKPLVRRNAVEVRNVQFGRDAEALAKKVRDALKFETTENRRWRVAAAGAIALLLAGSIGLYQMGVPLWAPWGAPPESTRRAEVGATLQAEEEAARKAQEEAARKALEEAARKAREEAVRRSQEEAARRAEEARRDPALAAAPGSGQGFRDRLASGSPCPMCPEMVVVPSGRFLMGAPAAELGTRTNEQPQRNISFSEPFAIGRYEITFAEWDACVSDGGCKHRPQDFGWGRGRQPVVDVSWVDAVEYTAWLSRKTGNKYRLPTQAEWEYSARAGTVSPFWWGRDTVGG